MSEITFSTDIKGIEDIKNPIKNLSITTLQDNISTSKVVINSENAKKALQIMQINSLIVFHLQNRGIITANMLYIYLLYVIQRPSKSIYQIYMICGRNADPMSNYTYKDNCICYIKRETVDGIITHYIGLIPRSMILSKNQEVIYQFLIDSVL